MKKFPTINTVFIRRIWSYTFDPIRDWLVLLGLSALILIGIVIWNVWAFSIVASGGVIGMSVKSATTTPDQSSLETIRTIFADRAKEEGKYVSGEYHFTDPSQ